MRRAGLQHPDLIPVDYCADTIVSGCNDHFPKAHGLVFHLTGGDPSFTLADLGAMLAAAAPAGLLPDGKLAAKEYPDWEAEMRKIALEKGAAFPLSALLSYLDRGWPGSSGLPSGATRQFLSQRGLPLPPAISVDVVRRYLAFYQAEGVLPGGA